MIQRITAVNGPSGRLPPWPGGLDNAAPRA
jgi:hypothetical protein